MTKTKKLQSNLLIRESLEIRKEGTTSGLGLNDPQLCVRSNAWDPLLQKLKDNWFFIIWGPCMGRGPERFFSLFLFVSLSFWFLTQSWILLFLLFSSLLILSLSLSFLIPPLMMIMLQLSKILAQSLSIHVCVYLIYDVLFQPNALFVFLWITSQSAILTKDKRNYCRDWFVITFPVLLARVFHPSW